VAKSLLSIALAVAPLCLSASEVHLKHPGFLIADDQEYREVGDKTLILNGRGIHRRIFFNVYELSLFLETKSSDPEHIINTGELKLVEMKFMRNVKSSQIQDNFRETFAELCEEKCEELTPHLNTFLELIPDLEKESKIDFVFFPTYLVIHLNQQSSATINSNDFSKLLLKSWVGEKPPSRSLKNKLLGI
jgi:hypothetical protein